MLPISIGGDVNLAVSHTLHKLDDRPIPGNEDEIRAVLKVRNEVLRLPSVLEHHRRLGIGRFFVVDNGSTDGTVDYLLAQHDVHCFYTDSRFSKSGRGCAWMNALLDAFGEGHWCLVVDADELFVFPAYESTGLRTLCTYLDQSGAHAVFAVLLDMYASTSVKATHYSPGQSFLAACPYFDPGPYKLVRRKFFPPFKILGGVRERIFWQNKNRSFPPPTISKVPLVKWQKGQKYVTNHSMTPPITLSEIWGVLLHFKFFADFHERVVQEVARGELYAGAREYRAYSEVLEQDPELTLHYEGSERYRDSEQLVQLGFMRTSKPYKQFVAHALSSPAPNPSFAS